MKTFTIEGWEIEYLKDEEDQERVFRITSPDGSESTIVRLEPFDYFPIKNTECEIQLINDEMFRDGKTSIMVTYPVHLSLE